MDVDDGSGAERYAAAWYPDPDGRHDQRYYDGTVWTERVRTAGIERSDLLDGSYLAPGAASTMAEFYPGERQTKLAHVELRNAPGAGLVVACLGWIAVAVSTQLAWFDGVGVYALVVPDASGFTVRPVQNLQTQVAIALFFLALVIIGTTLRYQPGKLFGFCYAGCLGLLVCWRKLDRDAPSTRSNLLGAFVVLVHGVVVWTLIAGVREDVPRLGDAELGTGVWAFTGGIVLVVVGVLIGRRRVIAS